jgi:metal-sulfur cluster biosynthetic enzyme
MPNKEEILSALKTVFDPEIPVNIVDLGFIYDIRVNGGKVEIDMTLTVPGCPMHRIISKQAEDAVRVMEGVDDVAVNLTFEPRWTVEKITDDGKARLRELGYNI